jgi:hypothetical protein
LKQERIKILLHIDYPPFGFFLWLMLSIIIGAVRLLPEHPSCSSAAKWTGGSAIAAMIPLVVVVVASFLVVLDAVSGCNEPG